jgi:GNAT superfamily N-acetyltransferase
MAAARVVAVTDDQGRIVAPEWLARAARVHRQLRPQLADDYESVMRRVLAAGAGMVVVVERDAVAGVAVFRWYDNTADGRKFYIDDLVIDEMRRSRGLGRTVLAHLEAEARRLGCRAMVLDSGAQRMRAHKFYFRENFYITSFNFKKQLT